MITSTDIHGNGGDANNYIFAPSTSAQRSPPRNGYFLDNNDHDFSENSTVIVDSWISNLISEESQSVTNNISTSLISHNSGSFVPQSQSVKKFELPRKNCLNSSILSSDSGIGLSFFKNIWSITDEDQACLSSTVAATCDPQYPNTKQQQPLLHNSLKELNGTFLQHPNYNNSSIINNNYDNSHHGSDINRNNVSNHPFITKDNNNNASIIPAEYFNVQTKKQNQINSAAHFYHNNHVLQQINNFYGNSQNMSPQALESFKMTIINYLFRGAIRPVLPVATPSSSQVQIQEDDLKPFHSQHTTLHQLHPITCTIPNAVIITNSNSSTAGAGKAILGSHNAYKKFYNGISPIPSIINDKFKACSPLVPNGDSQHNQNLKANKCHPFSDHSSPYNNICITTPTTTVLNAPSGGASFKEYLSTTTTNKQHIGISPRITYPAVNHQGNGLSKNICPQIYRFPNTKKSYPALMLQFFLEECFAQFKALEKERKKCEAELARTFPGRSLGSDNIIPLPTLPATANPSRIDRMIVDHSKEHAKVFTLLNKMSTVFQEKLPRTVYEKVEFWINAIRVVQTKRREEIKNGSSILVTTATNYFNIASSASVAGCSPTKKFQDEKDILALSFAIKELARSTKAARTALWSALNLTVDRSCNFVAARSIVKALAKKDDAHILGNVTVGLDDKSKSFLNNTHFVSGKTPLSYILPQTSNWSYDNFKMYNYPTSKFTDDHLSNNPKGNQTCFVSNKEYTPSSNFFNDRNHYRPYPQQSYFNAISH